MDLPAWRCSGCGQPMDAEPSCTCTDAALVLKNLPMPADDANPQTLLNRWSCIVRHHPHMRRFRADLYLADHGSKLCDAMAERGRILRDDRRQMTDDYDDEPVRAVSRSHWGKAKKLAPSKSAVKTPRPKEAVQLQVREPL